MNDTQKQILYTILKIQNEQDADSPYFDPKSGGTNSDNFGMDFKTVEAEAVELQKMGYINIFTDPNPEVVTKRLQLTTSGLGWVQGDMATVQQAEAIVAEQKIQADFEASENARVTADFNRMTALGLFKQP